MILNTPGRTLPAEDPRRVAKGVVHPGGPTPPAGDPILPGSYLLLARLRKGIVSGFCQAWSMDGSDGAPRYCAALKTRAANILSGALETPEVPAERWQEAGLALDARYGFLA